MQVGDTFLSSTSGSFRRVFKDASTTIPPSTTPDGTFAMRTFEFTLAELNGSACLSGAKVVGQMEQTLVNMNPSALGTGEGTTTLDTLSLAITKGGAPQAAISLDVYWFTTEDTSTLRMHVSDRSTEADGNILYQQVITAPNIIE